MKTLRLLTYINFKLHKYLIITGLLALFIYTGYIAYVLLISENDAGNTLQLSSYLIQSGMLFFMLLGFQFSKKNIKSRSFQDVVGSNNVKRIHVVNILFLLLTSLLFVLLTLFSFLFYYSVMTSFSAFGKESTLFLIHYWLLPFWIMGIIGYIFGINSNSKIIYVLLIAIWAIVSPTNLDFFNNLLNNMQVNRIEWLENLNLGVYNMSYPYHPFYGFEYNWTKGVILLLIVLSFYFISLFTINIRKLQVLNIIAVMLTLVVFSLYPNDYTKQKIDDLNKFIEDYDYYNDYFIVKDECLFDYEINSIDLKIENYKEFDVEVLINISFKNQSKLGFTLYQGFNVSKIEIKNEGSVRFNQEGDYIEVFLPGHIRNKQQIDLHITYSGSGSNFRPATSKYIYLPADFVWIPSNNASRTHFMFNDDIIPSSVKLSSKIKYTLNYSGSKRLDYVNIPENREGIFEGTTSGITLILGDLTSGVIDEQKMYYPSSWFLYNKEIENYLDEFHKVLRRYNDIFNTNYKLPKEIILLPNMDMNGNYNYINSYGDDDHIILQINPNNLTKLIETNEPIPFQIEKAFRNNSFTESEGYAAWFVYNSMLGHYIISTTNLEGSKGSKSLTLNEFHLHLAESSIETRYKTIYEQLIDIEEKGLSDDFFVEWRSILYTNDNWGKLGKLINEQ